VLRFVDAIVPCGAGRRCQQPFALVVPNSFRGALRTAGQISNSEVQRVENGGARCPRSEATSLQQVSDDPPLLGALLVRLVNVVLVIMIAGEEQQDRRGSYDYRPDDLREELPCTLHAQILLPAEPEGRCPPTRAEAPPAQLCANFRRLSRVHYRYGSFTASIEAIRGERRGTRLELSLYRGP
jgi:hypothetical protein